MTYPTVIVNGVSVRVDTEGRYNLNDLHAAAVLNGEATESQKPSKFIRSGSVKRFVRALDARGQKCPLEQNQSLKVIRGGDSQSVWGVEMIAIRYAAWLNPDFEIRVYETFRESVLNGISHMNQLNRLDLLIASEAEKVSGCARTMNHWGRGGRKQLLNNARARIIEHMDPDMVTIMQKSAA